MPVERSRDRDPRLDRLQRTLEEGLQAIADARTAAEAEAARHRTRARLEALAYRREVPPKPVSGR